MADTIYEATGSYNPKAPKNIQTYGEIQEALPATVAELKEKVPQHTDFIGYLIRRGGLAEVGKPRAEPKPRKNAKEKAEKTQPKPQISLKGKQSAKEPDGSIPFKE